MERARDPRAGQPTARAYERGLKRCSHARPSGPRT